jgi:hypothetical protein
VRAGWRAGDAPYRVENVGSERPDALRVRRGVPAAGKRTRMRIQSLYIVQRMEYSSHAVSPSSQDRRHETANEIGGGVRRWDERVLLHMR